MWFKKLTFLILKMQVKWYSLELACHRVITLYVNSFQKECLMKCTTT